MKRFDLVVKLGEGEEAMRFPKIPVPNSLANGALDFETENIFTQMPSSPSSRPRMVSHISKIRPNSYIWPLFTLSHI